MAKVGRPGYSETQRATIVDHIVAELACGRSVKRILEEDEGMPASSQFWKWHFESVEIQEKVACAREHGATAVLEEALDIADDGTNDWRKRHGDEEDEDVLNHEHISRSKLRVETRYKYAQMIAPRKYGPKLDLTSGGEKLGLTSELEAARQRIAKGGENG